MKLWREDPPVQNDEGEIIKGGMFGHQKDWWNLPNYIKALIAGYDEPFIQKGCFECLLNTESGRSVLYNNRQQTTQSRRSTSHKTVVCPSVPSTKDSSWV